MNRIAAIAALVAFLGTSEAGAEQIKPLFDALASADSDAARRQAVAAILAVEAVPTEEVIAILGRERASGESDRRSFLRGLDLDVPDAKGRFRAPKRQTKLTEEEGDNLDWLAKIYSQAGSPSVSDAMVDIVAIRTLARTQDTAAARAILDFAFSEQGTAYRDECGRYLRKMAPWSIAGLIYGGYTRKNSADMRRYAKYQLERLDRQAPRKALQGAPTDSFMVEILTAFAESQYREAVFVVLDTVNHDSPEVRAAARAAWMEYATGRPAPKAPRQKLQLPGGKQSDKEQPLWLNHRELADIAIRRRLEELVGAAPAKDDTLAAMSKRLFDHYDQGRDERLHKDLEAGLAASREGKIGEAAAIFDRVLAQKPSYERRDAMADVFLAYGEELEKQGKPREAATAFGKAHALNPTGEIAETALARHHRARGHALEAEGKDGASSLARASALDGAAGSGGDNAAWMLYVGVGGAVGGVLMLIWGLVSRRRTRWSP